MAHDFYLTFFFQYSIKKRLFRVNSDKAAKAQRGSLLRCMSYAGQDGGQASA
jgi:hypothetical protein